MTIDERADGLYRLTVSFASILWSSPTIMVELAAAVDRRIRRAVRRLR